MAAAVLVFLAFCRDTSWHGGQQIMEFDLEDPPLECKESHSSLDSNQSE
ncbi:MAG: hypothetical protein ACTSUE_14475 [Promethearchaeota archaeon]